MSREPETVVPILENPFTPTFGEIPARLAGRAALVDRMARAFESERRRPEATTIISGARGTGKTTLLGVLAERAAMAGWITADVTATDGMLEDIEVRVRKGTEHLVARPSHAHVKNLGIPQVVEFEFEREQDRVGNWRSRMEDILDVLEENGSGLLITVDELDPGLDEMVTLASVYQHFIREDRRVALLMAGLPGRVSALLNDKTVSFLRRSEMVHLGRISDFEIEDALLKTIESGGRTYSGASLDNAVESIGGFPFLMQLVGFRAWDEHPECEVVTSEDFENGIRLAREEMRTRIFEATYRELSRKDVEFLEAMLADEVESNVGDLVTRLGWSRSNVAQYRRRLLETGVIGVRSRGVIGFDMPFFREYLLEKVASDDLSTT